VRFYLVRHGDAVSANVDPLRPLSVRGRAAVGELAKLSASRSVEVAEICHSGILRARETAEILASCLNPPGGVREIAGLLPEDAPVIGKTELETATEPIMLVGHLPHLQRLAALLLPLEGAGGSAIEFGPATMICCSKNCAGWHFSWQLQPQL